MYKNIAIIIVIAAIIGGLVFVLAQRYAVQNQEQTVNITTPKVPAKPAAKEVSVGVVEGATSTEQEIQNIDLGDIKGDFNQVDTDINSL